MYFDGLNSFVLYRSHDSTTDQLFLYGGAQGQTAATGFPFSALLGTLRIVRTGGLIEFMGLTEGSWTVVGSWTGAGCRVQPGVGER